MAYGKGGVSSSSLNQHKAMAGAGMSGNFGVTKMPQRDYKHPDASMKHMPMDDGMRSAPVKGDGRMMQGSADHGVGKGHMDHFMRDGKA